MPNADLGTTTGQWVGAAVPLVLAFVLAFVVDRAFSRRGGKLAGSVIRGGISRQADTRLRFVRRLVYATILLIGIALALRQFDGIKTVAGSVLASGAIAAAIVGFAAQRTLANFVAGVMLAISQPLRIGDWVAFEDHYGVVEDVRLNFTILRTPGDQRIIIPNEKLASGVLRNDTLRVDTVALDVAVWLPAGTDADRAVRVLEQETGAGVAVAEVTVDAIRLGVGGERVPPREKAGREAELRLACLRRLRAEGLLARGDEGREGSPTG
jgi:small-conductance mechanosensitive channel